MAFTVSDFHDLLALLADHPEWREQLRREVLSEELLRLPETMARTNETVDRVGAKLDRLTERMDQQTVQIQHLTERMDRVEQQLQRLTQAVLQLETRVGGVEGEVLELRYARRAPAYFSRLALRLRMLEVGSFVDMLDEALMAEQINGDERDALLNADLVMSGRRRSDGAEVYLLAEISVGIRAHDVERAADRGSLLRKLGREVIPVVAGRQINAEAANLAAERHVWYVLEGRAVPPASSSSPHPGLPIPDA